ncbi:DivIVA domain-containing protein [Nigerium massiliense]|uniref:DivIVA domain-containing protein n=1 Tax=Nigerium massiliense TaxID=1522317 RepID=UPI000907A214|nr:DivIVA domain-containing protein [Nigerium massiliense]
MPGLEWVIYACAVLVLAIAALVAGGRFQGMPPVVTDVPAPAERTGPVTADELRGVRFGVVMRGYSPAQVDALLDRIANQLVVQEASSRQSAARPDAGVEDAGDVGIGGPQRGRGPDDPPWLG